MPARDEDWDIKVYDPPEDGWPYVVVTRHKKTADDDAQFADSRDHAEKLSNQIHERLWRGKYKTNIL